MKNKETTLNLKASQAIASLGIACESKKWWTEENKKISNAWLNYWNYIKKPLRDDIEKWWFSKFKQSLLTAYQQGKKERDEEIVKILDWRNKDDEMVFYDGDNVVEWIDMKLKTLSNQNNEK